MRIMPRYNGSLKHGQKRWAIVPLIMEFSLVGFSLNRYASRATRTSTLPHYVTSRSDPPWTLVIPFSRNQHSTEKSITWIKGNVAKKPSVSEGKWWQTRLLTIPLRWRDICLFLPLHVDYFDRKRATLGVRFYAFDHFDRYVWYPIRSNE